MPNAFRKRGSLVRSHDLGGDNHSVVEVMQTKDVVIDGSPNTVVECVKKDVKKYARELGLPSSEDYKLEVMLRAGHIPEEVPVSGILDDHDPTSLVNSQNASAAPEMFAQLQRMEPASDPEPKTE